MKTKITKALCVILICVGGWLMAKGQREVWRNTAERDTEGDKIVKALSRGYEAQSVLLSNGVVVAVNPKFETYLKINRSWELRINEPEDLEKLIAGVSALKSESWQVEYAYADSQVVTVRFKKKISQ